MLEAANPRDQSSKAGRPRQFSQETKVATPACNTHTHTHAAQPFSCSDGVPRGVGRHRTLLEGDEVRGGRAEREGGPGHTSYRGRRQGKRRAQRSGAQRGRADEGATSERERRWWLNREEVGEGGGS
jgi:hypothetical protein